MIAVPGYPPRSRRRLHRLESLLEDPVGAVAMSTERVISLIHSDNHASCRVTEKNGMTIEKRTTFRGFPTIVFSMNQQSWQRQARSAACRSMNSSAKAR